MSAARSAASGRRGGLIGSVGALAGGINIKKGEANVTLSVVNARTTEEAVVEGYYRKTDVGFGAAAGAGWWGGFAAAGGGGYQNTEIGQVIVLAFSMPIRSWSSSSAAGSTSDPLAMMRRGARFPPNKREGPCGMSRSSGRGRPAITPPRRARSSSATTSASTSSTACPSPMA